MPSHYVSVTELVKMTEPELLQEIRSHRSELQKARMNITLNKEKDTAQYRRNRAQIARMETALTMIRSGMKPQSKALKPVKKSSTVSAPSRKTRP